MIFDKKKSVSVILSKMGKDGRTSESSVAHESGEHDEYSSYAEDMIAALESKSVQKLAACLKSFHQMIMHEDAEQDAGE